MDSLKKSAFWWGVDRFWKLEYYILKVKEINMLMQRTNVPTSKTKKELTHMHTQYVTMKSVHIQNQYVELHIELGASILELEDFGSQHTTFGG